MAIDDELPVYKATYDLLLAIFQFTKEFSKEYKYTVGESLKKRNDKTINKWKPTKRQHAVIFNAASACK